MKWTRLMILAALALPRVSVGMAADPPATNPATVPGAPNVPPVLRSDEPPDSVQITLPGPPGVEPVQRVIVGVAPVAKAAALPRTLVLDPTLRRAVPVPTVASIPIEPSPKPIPLPTVPAATAKPSPMPGPALPVQVATARPSPRPAPIPAVPGAAAVAGTKPSPHPELRSDAAVYCRNQIGHWKESDARKLLGNPSGHRPAYDENKAVNGTIYAFADPTNKYKELELDFDLDSGNLRTVFAYPSHLTWEECRRQWSGPTAATDAARGRKFYSYTNRRLDVLVDPAGKVISLGWY